MRLLIHLLESSLWEPKGCRFESYYQKFAALQDSRLLHSVTELGFSCRGGKQWLKSFSVYLVQKDSALSENWTWDKITGTLSRAHWWKIWTTRNLSSYSGMKIFKVPLEGDIEPNKLLVRSNSTRCSLTKNEWHSTLARLQNTQLCMSFDISYTSINETHI